MYGEYDHLKEGYSSYGFISGHRKLSDNLREQIVRQLFYGMKLRPFQDDVRIWDTTSKYTL